MNSNLKILSSGIYLPKQRVSSEEIDQKIGKALGSCFKSSGVKFRYYSDIKTETSSYMGARAAENALSKCGIQLDDIDLILCTSGTPQQVIPCTGSLILKELNAGKLNIPAFDVNSTCLSFVVGMDMASALLWAGKYKRILLISSEISRVGIDYDNIETASLFGDGAVAFVVGGDETGQSKVLESEFNTLVEGIDHCQIEGGGSKIPIEEYNHGDKRFKFQMDGRKVVRLAMESLPRTLNSTIAKSNLNRSEIKMFIPHQASKTGMELVRKKLEIPEEKWFVIIEEYGNMISASVPLALHLAIESGKIKKGDPICLVGTSAGFSTGIMVLRY